MPKENDANTLKEYQIVVMDIRLTTKLGYKQKNEKTNQKLTKLQYNQIGGM